MTSSTIVTSVTATLPPERKAEFVSGYRELSEDEKPDGLLRSELLCGDDGRWLIQTLWRDRAAILEAPTWTTACCADSPRSRRRRAHA